MSGCNASIKADAKSVASQMENDAFDGFATYESNKESVDGCRNKCRNNGKNILGIGVASIFGWVAMDTTNFWCLENLI